MANVIFLQTLAVQAAQAVKVDALKVQQHLAAVVATKEVANVVANAEVAGNQVVIVVVVQVARR